jgi:hypothetical protein
MAVLILVMVSNPNLDSDLLSILSPMARASLDECPLLPAELANSGGEADLMKRMKTSHKTWMWRLNVVLELENWIKRHLKRKGAYDRRDRTEQEMEKKAQEYLCGYLFWGRTRYTVGTDPLFFRDTGESIDGSLSDQMVMGAYDEFINEFNRLTRMPAALVSTPEVSIDEVEMYLDGISKGSVDSCINQLPLSEERKQLERIGLILRYRCVGGFSCNLHGSVSKRWSDALPNFIECFASPLNHKFQAFHSMFDEDRAFSGRGDFFQFLSVNGGSLPSGNYEINPPFHVELMGKVADAVKSSVDIAMVTAYPLQIVCILPEWSDSEFIGVMESIVQKYPGNAIRRTKHYRYNHVCNDRLRVNTIFYIISTNTVVQEDRENFNRICNRLIDAGQ